MKNFKIIRVSSDCFFCSGTGKTWRNEKVHVNPYKHRPPQQAARNVALITQAFIIKYNIRSYPLLFQQRLFGQNGKFYKSIDNIFELRSKATTMASLFIAERYGFTPEVERMFEKLNWWNK